MECFYNIIDDDDDTEFDGSAEDYDKYRRIYEKDSGLFMGEKVAYGDYICYMIDVKEEANK